MVLQTRVAMADKAEQMPQPSCLDSSQQAEIPPELDQNYMAPESQYDCTYNVGWERSDYMVALMDKHDADAADYVFKVCWDAGADPGERHFPWVQSATGDFRYMLAMSGSITLTPMDQVNTWAYGIQNVMPDALDYYARMGEVANRKIIPKFMMFGWSKGATYFWPLGRWRQDLVQASILLHGCDTKTSAWTTDLPKKSVSKGVVPHLFGSSKLDTFSGCTYSSTTKQYKNQLKNQKETFYLESPCGHHPENCWPVCAYNDTYLNPFWDFVELAYSLRQPCTETTDQKSCEEQLCIWDEPAGFCDEVHPTRLSPSCERFCPKTEVASCGDLDEATCGTSYRLLSIDEANADGMFSACEMVEGICTQSSSSYQCFFQDQCS